MRASTCPLCGAGMERVIYCGLPGRLCVNRACNCLDGLAAYAPPIAGENEFGDPAFAFFPYTGSYWRALWRWLTMPLD